MYILLLILLLLLLLLLLLGKTINSWLTFFYFQVSDCLADLRYSNVCVYVYGVCPVIEKVRLLLLLLLLSFVL